MAVAKVIGRDTDLGQSGRHEKGLIDGRQVAGYTHTHKQRKESEFAIM